MTMETELERERGMVFEMWVVHLLALMCIDNSHRGNRILHRLLRLCLEIFRVMRVCSDERDSVDEFLLRSEPIIV